MRGEKPRFPFDAQDLDEALKDHAVNGRSSPWPNKRGHHFFMAVLRSFLALCVLGEAFGTLLNFSENDQFVGKTDNMGWDIQSGISYMLIHTACLSCK